jgi:FAD/FMN-containing dehydrogenase
MLTRRTFTKWTSILPTTYLLPGTCSSVKQSAEEKDPGLWVNDIHSQLNATHLRASVRPASVQGLQQVVRDAQERRFSLCIAGGRHAMGGQQFLSEGVLVDMRGMNRIVAFDQQRGLIEVGAGIEWPALIDYLEAAQAGSTEKWTIAQKQTGADRLTLGGALSANAHGRGLAMKPMIADVESFALVDAVGALRKCSRTDNAELFRLAIGGYGLFGIIATVTLRLVRRQKLERVVEIVETDKLMPAFDDRIAAGFLYGDWQFAIDPASADFLSRGVFSCYRSIDPATPISEAPKELTIDEWRNLMYLAHTDKAKAWELYSGHYLATSGQVYWSDRMQQSVYIDDYHRELDPELSGGKPATEMISEIYVPRAGLSAFLAEVRADFRANAVNLIYGTVRLIERDDESFLAWATQPWACVIFNLHVAHDEPSLAKAANDFRRLIDRGRQHGGSYYLTYHRWANRAEMAAAYPNFPEFLRLKRQYDPEERFQSDWYRQYRDLFATRT